jgi:hypothetical protein
MLSERFVPLHTLPCGGSVATTAIEIALFLGADPVFVTGLDLSFTYFYTHAVETANDRYFHRLSSRLETVHSLVGDRIHKRNLLFLPGLDGGKVLSDFVFGNYLDWFSHKGEYLHRVYNVTERGVEIPPLGRFRLENLISEKHRKKRIPPGLFPMIRGLGGEKPPFRAPAGNILSMDTCMRFLVDLKKEMPRARTSLSWMSDQNGWVHPLDTQHPADVPHPADGTHLTDEKHPADVPHPLIRNILALSLSIHRDRVSACSHVHLFLDMLEKNVLRSIQHMKEQNH